MGGAMGVIESSPSPLPGAPDAARAVGAPTTEEELRAVLTNTRAIIWDAEVHATPGWEEYDPDASSGRVPWVWKTRINDEHAAQVILPLEVPAGRTYASVW